MRRVLERHDRRNRVRGGPNGEQRPGGDSRFLVRGRFRFGHTVGDEDPDKGQEREKRGETDAGFTTNLGQLRKGGTSKWSSGVGGQRPASDMRWRLLVARIGERAVSWPVRMLV